MRRTTATTVLAFWAAVTGAMPARAAVEVNDERKPAPVAQTAPPAGTPPAGATPPGGTAPPGARPFPNQKFPGLNLPFAKRRKGDTPPPTPAVTPPTPAATMPAAAAAAATPPSGTASASGQLAGEKEFNSCKKFPAGKRIVKLNLKPDTELGDLISWISSITCKQFILPGTIPGNSRKVTIVAPQLITPEEAYRLFLAALDSVGLTVEPSGKFLRIIETLRAKSTSIPV